MRSSRAVIAVIAVLAAVVVAGFVVLGDGDDQNAPRATSTTGVAGPLDRSGHLDDGAEWRLRVREDWNGTLVVYSRGSVPPGRESTVRVAPDEITAAGLLGRGYAIIGSSYERSGWVLESAIRDQHALIDVAASILGEPQRVIAWGSSLGALVTVGLLEQHPDDVDGGVALCGVVAGPDALWDRMLDITFAMRTLLAPDAPIGLTGLRGRPEDALRALLDLQATASERAAGRARLALALAVADVPAWATGAPARPPGDDGDALLEAQLANLTQLLLPMTTTFRADMERHVGGNPSSNEGVDYGALLAASTYRPLVEAFYRTARLDLDADLARLAATPRVAADPAARTRLLAPVDPTGALEGPLLTLHTTGDGLAAWSDVAAYADRVAAAGRSERFRQVSIERSGHCFFSAAEQLAVLDALVARLDEGAWPDLGAAALRARADAMGRHANVFEHADGATTRLAPGFVDRSAPPSPRAAAGVGADAVSP